MLNVATCRHEIYQKTKMELRNKKKSDLEKIKIKIFLMADKNQNSRKKLIRIKEATLRSHTELPN